MKSIKTLGIIGVVAGMCLMQAHATLNLTSYGYQPGNSGNAVAPWVNSLVKNYNSTPNSDLPSIGSSYAFKASPSAPSGYPNVVNNLLSIVIPTGSYEYVVLHWGNGQSGNNAYQLFYIGDAADIAAGCVTFTAPSRNGLSWYSLWCPTPNTPNTPPGQASVPEPSTIIAGVLLLIPFGIQGVRQFRKRNQAP